MAASDRSQGRVALGCCVLIPLNNNILLMPRAKPVGYYFDVQPRRAAGKDGGLAGGVLGVHIVRRYLVWPCPV